MAAHVLSAIVLGLMFLPVNSNAQTSLSSLKEELKKAQITLKQISSEYTQRSQELRGYESRYRNKSRECQDIIKQHDILKKNFPNEPSKWQGLSNKWGNCRSQEKRLEDDFYHEKARVEKIHDSLVKKRSHITQLEKAIQDLEKR
jgi:chromosome segregation ATPase